MKTDKKQINDFDDFEEMVKAHRGVLKSLIDQDGYFKNGEEVEINNGFVKQLIYMKLKLEAYKMMREKPTRDELFLPVEKNKNKQNKNRKQIQEIGGRFLFILPAFGTPLSVHYLLKLENYDFTRISTDLDYK